MAIVLAVTQVPPVVLADFSAASLPIASAEAKVFQSKVETLCLDAKLTARLDSRLGKITTSLDASDANGALKNTGIFLRFAAVQTNGAANVMTGAARLAGCGKTRDLVDRGTTLC